MARPFLKLSLVLSALLVAFLVAACGGGSAPAPTQAPAKPAAAEPTKAPAAAPAAAPTKAAAAAPAASAVKWPTKNVVFITHTSPGGGGDIFNRAVAKAAEKPWGQSVVVENRTGASGANAFIATRDAKPDGYTLMGQTPTLITATLMNKMPVLWSDLQPVAQVSMDIMILYVKYDAPYKDAKELVAAAKSGATKQRWGGGSVGSTDNWLVDQVLLSQDLKGKVEYVPFEGGGDVVTAVAGGQIVAGVGEYGEMAPAIDAKKIKVVGVGADQRIPGLDMPTLKEQGIDATMVKFRGFFGPKGIPADTLTAVAAGLKVASDTPEFQKWATDNKQLPTFKGPEEFSKVVADEAAKFKDFMAKAGIAPK
ncbi:MAG: tripartite tricarboxylate transporter substrate binding protein [Actinobacteria bacterium]|nr:tripartite tricarboxylate transporter substrate binding protein [Actinomycetota bacterium]